MSKLTPEQRHAEFLSIFQNNIPGKPYMRVKQIADILCCTRVTVRTYCMEKSPRPIPESKLKILKRGLGLE